jgi:hypothetical protein
MMMEGFELIATAPRDGTVIEVAAEEQPPIRMRWNPEGENPPFTLGPGVWETPDGEVTWSEARGFGPTHWRPAPTH